MAKSNKGGNKSNKAKKPEQAPEEQAPEEQAPEETAEELQQRLQEEAEETAREEAAIAEKLRAERQRRTVRVINNTRHSASDPTQPGSKFPVGQEVKVARTSWVDSQIEARCFTEIT